MYRIGTASIAVAFTLLEAYLKHKKRYNPSVAEKPA
jgi:hypothetical protein